MIEFEAVRVEPTAIRLGGHVVPARRDVATGDVTLTAEDGTEHVVRQWTFAERTRLLDVYATNRVRTDVTGLVEAIGALLVTPEPAADAAGALGLAALAWAAGGGAPEPSPPPGVATSAQVVTLAAATHWSPEKIQSSPAADVDRWYAACRPAPATAPDGAARPDHPADTGFHTYRLVD